MHLLQKAVATMTGQRIGIPGTGIEIEKLDMGAVLHFDGRQAFLDHGERERLVAGLGWARTTRDQAMPARVRRAYKALRGL